MTAMISNPLSRRDVTLLKGFGILLIFLHNYFHAQPGMDIENEFRFKPWAFQHFLDHAFLGWTELVRYTMAFLGHYGVQLFVLTSGYGLYASAQAKGGVRFSPRELGPRLIKILALLLIGILVVYVTRYFGRGILLGYKSAILILIGRMTTVWNFSFDTLLGYAGPFWFFGLIIQLYVVFPFIGRWVERLGQRQGIALLAGATLLAALLYPVALKVNVPVMGLFIGHLPVFLMGMLLARHGYRTNLPVLLLALVLFVLGLRMQVFFAATFPAITYLMLAAYMGLKQLRSKTLSRLAGPLAWLGGVSMTVFVVNGPLRDLPLFRDGAGELATERVFLFTVVLLLAAMPLAWLYRWINDRLQQVYANVLERWGRSKRDAVAP